MSLTKHISPWILGAAILVTLAFVIPGLVKTALALIALASLWGAIESFRDRDVVPGIVFAPFSLICAVLAGVSQ